jgi:chromosome segregation ATPase
MEIEQGVPKEIDRINENARFEKNNLVRELEQRTEELNELRRGQEKTLANVKNRYEEALRSSQETLEEQTSLFNQQIVKLEEYLTRANEQINILKKELDERDKERHSGKSHREEILKMQSLIDNANNELDNYRKKYGDLQKSYDRDVNEMRESFNRYKKAQDIVVQSLESQLQTMNSNANANVNDTSIEFEEKYRKLEYRFKAKSVELDAVMKALARSGNSFEEDSVTNASSVIDLSVPPPHPRSPSRNNYNVNDSGIISNVTISKDIRDDLYEVKIKAAESEIEALSLSLSKEKQANQHLRKQVQGTLEKTGEAMLADHHLHHHSNINTNTDDNGETFLKGIVIIILSSS